MSLQVKINSAIAEAKAAKEKEVKPLNPPFPYVVKSFPAGPFGVTEDPPSRAERKG